MYFMKLCEPLKRNHMLKHVYADYYNETEVWNEEKTATATTHTQQQNIFNTENHKQKEYQNRMYLSLFHI